MASAGSEPEAARAQAALNRAEMPPRNEERVLAGLPCMAWRRAATSRLGRKVSGGGGLGHRARGAYADGFGDGGSCDGRGGGGGSSGMGKCGGGGGGGGGGKGNGGGEGGGARGGEGEGGDGKGEGGGGKGESGGKGHNCAGAVAGQSGVK